MEQLGEPSAFTRLLRPASIKSNKAKQTKETNVSFRILRIILWYGSQAPGFSCVKPVVYKVWRGFNRQIHVLLLLFAVDGESREATTGRSIASSWERRKTGLENIFRCVSFRRGCTVSQVLAVFLRDGSARRSDDCRSFIFRVIRAKRICFKS